MACCTASPIASPLLSASLCRRAVFSSSRVKILPSRSHARTRLSSAAGSTLIKYAKEGHDVYVLTTTRGEGGSTGEPPVFERSELGHVREQEGHDAGAVIGARQVLFLPYVDPRMPRMALPKRSTPRRKSSAPRFKRCWNTCTRT